MHRKSIEVLTGFNIRPDDLPPPSTFKPAPAKATLYTADGEALGRDTRVGFLAEGRGR